MPPPTRPTARQRYTQEDLQKALDAIKEGSTIGKAAKTYGVPKTTLHDKINGKYKHEAPVGRPSVLTGEEERRITQWVIDIGRAGFPVSKQQLLDSVGKLTRELGRENPFTNGVPGDKWYSLFLKRNPIIAERVSQGLTNSRANVSEEQIREWFAEVKEYIENKNIIDVFKDPTRVFNADESAFFLCPKGRKVLVKKGEKAVNSVSGNNEKECITVLVNGNAAGELAPTMVVYSYERIPAAIALSFPNEWAISKSETGWMTSATFFEYITNVFHPWLISAKIKLPVVLFIDGHSSHLSVHLSTFCSENQIELIALFPNSTHLLQPMDVSVFKPLKAGWKKGVEKWRFENGGRRMKKEEFAPLLKQVMDDSLKKEVVASGFRATGLGDLDPDKVHYNNLIRNKREETSNNNLAEKLKECKRYLAFTEVKIGLAKVRMFNSGDVLLRDESLYEFWKSIKQEVADLSKKLQERTETENKTGLGAEEVEDEPEVPEDDLTAEAGIILAQATYENEIVDIDLPFFEDLLGEKTSSMEVNVIYHQAHEETNSPPLSEDDIEPTFDIVPVSTPPAASSSCSHSTTAPSTNVSPVRVTSSVSFPTAVPSHSSFSPSTIYPLPSSTSLPNLPSPFKRCLLFPTPLSAKKKKLKGEVMPCTISGDKFKEYMKRKEEKKQEKEKEIKRKREERKEKKKIKEQKTTQKKNVCQKEKIVVEN